MLIYTLRHCQRDTGDIFFDSSLNNEGMEDKKRVLNDLHLINPDIIYCSPYKRCIQTIIDYVMLEDKNIIIDNCLTEYFDEELPPGQRKIGNVDTLDIWDTIKQHINNGQEDTITNDEIDREDHDQVRSRLSSLYNSIVDNEQFAGKTILLVSHKDPIEMLYRINGREVHDYEMGEICRIK